MTEITFKIEHRDNCDTVTIYEDGIKCQVHHYSKGMPEEYLLIHTAAEWYGVDLKEIKETM